MIYKDLEKCSSLEEREKFLHEFYSSIEIEKWLNVDLLQILRFKDRVEYKKNNKRHNILGAAVVYLDKKLPNEYYIDGVKYVDEEAWKPLAIRMQRENKLNKL